jgi:molybdate transport system substrate-binding protein
MHGAPYDIFFSADMKRPGKLWKKGLAANRPLPYAYGRLILLSGKKWKGEMTLKRAIEETGERIILANPELAPYGKAAMEVLKKTGMFARVKPGLVTAENVVQSARYALLGKGTCFTALSLLNAPAFRKREGEITWIEIDKKLYGEIKQGVVILSKSKKTETAKSFFDFVLNSKQAKRTIRHYGYTPAGEYLQGKKR